MTSTTSFAGAAAAASPAASDAGEPESAVVQFDHLSFGYGDTVVLEDISFSVAAGEFLSIIGPSGCGKSTLLTLLDGMVAPDHGRVLVDGIAPRPGDESRAMVFQNFALMPWKTVADNVELGLSYRKRRASRATRNALAQRALDKVGLSKSAALYPRQLSGGMQQRVGLARAFAVQPRILLMDEPFGALDAQTSEVLRDQLRGMVGDGTTVIFVTHNLDEALQLSDRVLLMTTGPGRIREDVRIDLPSSDDAAYAGKYEEYRSRIWEHLKTEVQQLEMQEAGEELGS